MNSNQATSFPSLDDIEEALLTQAVTPKLPAELEFKKRKFQEDLSSFNYAIHLAQQKLADATTCASVKKGKKQGEIKNQECMVQVYKLNLTMAQAAQRQSLLLTNLLQTMRVDIAKDVPSLLEIIDTVHKIMRLFHYRLLWQNKLNVSTNWIELCARMKSHYNSFCKFVTEHSAAYYVTTAVVVVANVVLGILFFPWFFVAAAGVGLASVLAKKFIFNKENTDMIWDTDLAKEITKVSEQLSGVNCSLSSIQASLKALLESCKHTAQVIFAKECIVCMEEFDSDRRRPCRFDNQGCRHLVCLGCAGEILEQGRGNAQCPTCRRDVTRIRTVCPNCNEFLIGEHSEWTCANGHIICAQCARRNADKCVYCYHGLRQSSWRHPRT